jgi:hypothetical protein
MPRVYIDGVHIPIQEVTWECLCDPATLVTDEDPHLDFCEDVYQQRDAAFESLTEFCAVADPWWWRLYRYFFPSNDERTHRQ